MIIKGYIHKKRRLPLYTAAYFIYIYIYRLYNTYFLCSFSPPTPAIMFLPVALVGWQSRRNPITLFSRPSIYFPYSSSCLALLVFATRTVLSSIECVSREEGQPGIRRTRASTNQPILDFLFLVSPRDTKVQLAKSIFVCGNRRSAISHDLIVMMSPIAYLAMPISYCCGIRRDGRSLCVCVYGRESVTFATQGSVASILLSGSLAL